MLNTIQYNITEASQVAQWKRICLTMQETNEMLVLSWVGKIPWRRRWQLTAVFLPGKLHRQRSLAGCSPWGRRESSMT